MELLELPESFGVLAVLSLGIPAQMPKAHELPDVESCEKISFHQ